ADVSLAVDEGDWAEIFDAETVIRVPDDEPLFQMPRQPEPHWTEYLSPAPGAGGSKGETPGTRPLDAEAFVLDNDFPPFGARYDDAIRCLVHFDVGAPLWMRANYVSTRLLAFDTIVSCPVTRKRVLPTRRHLRPARRNLPANPNLSTICLTRTF